MHPHQEAFNVLQCSGLGVGNERSPVLILWHFNRGIMKQNTLIYNMGCDPRMTIAFLSVFKHSSDNQHGGNMPVNALLALAELASDNNNSLI